MAKTNLTVVIWSDFAAAALTRGDNPSARDAAILADKMLEEFKSRFTYDDGRAIWVENVHR